MTITRSSVDCFTPAQCEVVNLLSCLGDEADVVALKSVLVKFLDARIQKELDRLYDLYGVCAVSCRVVLDTNCLLQSIAQFIVTNDAHFDVLANIPFPKVCVRTIDDFLSDFD